MGKKYTENRPKPKKSPTGADVRCFYALILELCKEYGTPRFVIDEDRMSKIKVWVTGDGIWVNGKLQDAKSGRIFLSAYREAFEYLFVQAMKEFVDIRQIMPRIYLANLLDTSGKTGKTAKMTFQTNAGKQILHIEYKDGMTKLRLNDKDISVTEAEAFVNENYMQFLAGIKGADRSMTHERSQNSKLKEYKARQKANMHKGVAHSRIVNGQLRVDLQSFIPQKQQTTSDELKRKELDLGKKKPGHIETNDNK